jgi:hypothetical protein
LDGHGVFLFLDRTLAQKRRPETAALGLVPRQRNWDTSLTDRQDCVYPGFGICFWKDTLCRAWYNRLI